MVSKNHEQAATIANKQNESYAKQFTSSYICTDAQSSLTKIWNNREYLYSLLRQNGQQDSFL